MTGLHRVLPARFLDFLDHEVDKLVERCLRGQVPGFMQDEHRQGEVIVHVIHLEGRCRPRD